MRLTLKTPAATTPLSLAECKAHLNVLFDDDDSLINGFLAAGVAHIDGRDGVLGRCILNQTWNQVMADWPCGRIIRLPFPDVSAVVVQYAAAGGGTETLSADNYFLREDSTSSYIEIHKAVDLPRLDYTAEKPVSIDLTAGFGATAGTVPEPIRQAILLLVGHWYENRNETSDKEQKSLPFAFNALIAPYRYVNF